MGGKGEEEVLPSKKRGGVVTEERVFLLRHWKREKRNCTNATGKNEIKRGKEERWITSWGGEEEGALSKVP